jgi:hypothetical protein
MITACSKILKVPYYIQPTPDTCQGTVLKMFAAFLDQKLSRSTPAAGLTPEQIKNTVNTHSDRPTKVDNAHDNFRWWLATNYSPLRPVRRNTGSVHEAIDWMVDRIDDGFPVVCSVTHANNKSGHIILVIGYENFRRMMSSIDFQLVAHDPYGAYHPGLQSTLYGKNRRVGGMCMEIGGEWGPGAAVRLPIHATSREHPSAHSFGQWLLSSMQG